MNIMIVDDSTRFIEKLTMSIHGITEISSVSRASKCEDVIKQFSKTQHELVVMDASRCTEDVIEISEFIKIEKPETTLIMLTDFLDYEDRKKINSIKGDYFFDRNKEYITLIETIVSIIYKISINNKLKMLAI